MPFPTHTCKSLEDSEPPTNLMFVLHLNKIPISVLSTIIRYWWRAILQTKYSQISLASILLCWTGRTFELWHPSRSSQRAAGQVEIGWQHSTHILYRPRDLKKHLTLLSGVVLKKQTWKLLLLIHSAGSWGIFWQICRIHYIIFEFSSDFTSLRCRHVAENVGTWYIAISE